MFKRTELLPWKDVPATDWDDWRWQISHSLTDIDSLARLLGMRDGQMSGFRAVLDSYPFRVTPYYLTVSDWTDADDPVRLQCIPDLREIEPGPGEDADPFAERDHMPVKGLIRRYRDRVLVIATNECAVFCRHCTRKNLLKEMSAHYSKAYFGPMIDYVAGNRQIREVIVSGGEPLLIDPSLLDWLLGSMGAIEHVEVLRIGTRIPAVLPMRIDRTLADMLASHRPLWINVQFNHPMELTRYAVDACSMLISRGIPVSNQCVLLKGVNDSVETMCELCNGLQRNLIRPYYVFQCDPVKGTGHFRTAETIGTNMEKALRKIVGGLSLPKFVVDMPGKEGKIPLQEKELQRQGNVLY